ncbi:biotin/lipoyl-containing protein [Nocardioides sp. NPDC000441]
MRIVRSPEELDEARAAAAREALSAFGDETLLIEKYVERGRHIEVQVFGDTHGNVIHLFERDCSVQRRHQKVIEEAPAPTLTDEQRNLVLTSAVALARQVDYTGAGTVEFLLDEASGEAYFLEMNTRLQVEHPVTEEAVRIDGAAADLVALQLRVAAGEPLGIAQDDVRIDGHAIEVRVYAEDAFEGFLPQAGRTSIVRWPAGARVEHALESEQVVSTAYDPMLAKIIVRGADREEARTAMVQALDATAVLGLTTNTGFLRVLAASDAFRDAEIDTAWLDRNEVPAPDPEVPRALVAWVSAMLSAASDTTTPFRADGWRLAGSPAPTIVDLDRSVTVDRPSGRVDTHLVRQISAAGHVLVAIVDGVRHWAAINVQPGLAEIVHQGHRFDFSPPDRVAGAAAHHSDGAVEAKMPGTVIDVRVQVGDQVGEGQVLGVMEAMKMEVSLKAPFAGTVTVVGASAGSQVPLGSELFVVEPTDD